MQQRGNFRTSYADILSHHSYMSLNLELHQSAYQYNVTTDAILTDFLKIESVILVRVEFRRETVLDFM